MCLISECKCTKKIYFTGNIEINRLHLPVNSRFNELYIYKTILWQDGWDGKIKKERHQEKINRVETKYEKFPMEDAPLRSKKQIITLNTPSQFNSKRFLSDESQKRAQKYA